MQLIYAAILAIGVLGSASIAANAQCNLSDFNNFNFTDQNDSGNVSDECNDTGNG
jgi:hypothetical protein